MIEPTEEQLMSFADGELDLETEQWVAAIVAQRPDLADKVAMYRETGRRLGDVVARGLPRRDDSVLTALIMGHPLPSDGVTKDAQAQNPEAKIAAAPAKATAPRGGGTVVQFPGRAPSRSSRRPSAPNFAVAAGIAALAAGAFAMTMMDWHSATPRSDLKPTVVGKISGGTNETAGATTLAAAELSRALETTPSTKTANVSGGWTVSPVLTFQDHDGRYCREYTAARASGGALYGVACRTAAVSWQDMAQAPLAKAPSGAVEPTRPAEIVGKAPPEVDKVIRRLQASDALGDKVEGDLIKRSWK